MKNCEYYEELIGAALDGEITAEEDKGASVPIWKKLRGLPELL